jgi:hypothetical protein
MLINTFRIKFIILAFISAWTSGLHFLLNSTLHIILGSITKKDKIAGIAGIAGAWYII